MVGVYPRADVHMMVRRFNMSMGVRKWAFGKLGALKILVAHGVGARQYVKIWTLGDYVLSLYSLNITEFDVKPK